ncbi:hypothetical protein GCM10020219_056910 [Nonomuraea dietziae]
MVSTSAAGPASGACSRPTSSRPLTQFLCLLGGGQFPQLDLDTRVAGAEAAQYPGQREVGRRPDEPDHQSARLPPADPSGRLHGERGMGQAGAGLGHESFTGGRETYLAGRAFEQSHAQFLFQFGDLLAERRLPHALAKRGPAEVELFGQRDGVAQLLEIHRQTISMGAHIPFSAV